jgi:hypothetical protein
MRPEFRDEEALAGLAKDAFMAGRPRIGDRFFVTRFLVSWGFWLLVSAAVASGRRRLNREYTSSGLGTFHAGRLRMSTTDARLRLKIRALRVSFADAGRGVTFDDRMRNRAREILESIALEMEPTGDPDLRDLLEAARREIEATDPSGL